ncbi:hypothetical protein JL720_15974 [Aureococcus anophagefferens]|nr:hypothetical protein JL720_15974 [Aureococcus anophagefferens]
MAERPSIAAKGRLPRGCAFGALAPAAFCDQVSWLPFAVLDVGTAAPLSVATDFERARRGRGEAAEAAAASAAVRRSDPKPAHLFAACAHGDADLVEALVLRCRVRVNARYKAADDWAGSRAATADGAQEGDGFVLAVTWCDVLGDRVSAAVRRLLLLRADPALDDGHPERSEVAEARERGADVSGVASGGAPVHALARDGFVDVVSTLIAFGANTLLENAEGSRRGARAARASFDGGA